MWGEWIETYEDWLRVGMALQSRPVWGEWIETAVRQSQMF